MRGRYVPQTLDANYHAPDLCPGSCGLQSGAPEQRGLRSSDVADRNPALTGGAPPKRQEGTSTWHFANGHVSLAHKSPAPF